MFVQAIKKQIKTDGASTFKLPGVLGQLAELAEKGKVASGYFVSAQMLTNQEHGHGNGE